MSRPSALDFWAMPRYTALFESLGLLEPQRTWEFLHEIREAELDAFEAEELEQTAARALATLRLAPRVGEVHDVEQVAADFARYMQTRYFDCVFLGIYAQRMLTDPDFARSLCSTVGVHLLDELDDAILLPLHMGPYPVIVPLLAAYHRVTTILDETVHLEFRAIIDTYLSGLDVEEITMPDRRVLVRCLRALKADRWLAMFPEFSWGYDQPKRTVSLFGAVVEAPEGAHRLAQRTGSPLVACTFVRDAPGHFALTFYEPFSVGEGESGLEAAVSRTFEIVESAVLERPGCWQGWDFFEELLATEGARAPLQARVVARSGSVERAAS